MKPYELRFLREEARQAVCALISANVDNWPDCDLATSAVFADLTDAEFAVLSAEFERIKRRIWPRPLS